MDNAQNSIDRLLPVLLFACCLLLGINKIWETDTWWHLKTGQVISESSSLPAKDVFSFTGGDKPWVNDEWLGDVYLYGIYSRHGMTGLTIAAAIAGALIFSFAFGACGLRGAPAALSAVVVAVAAVAARTRITPRPDVFALLLFSADLYLLNRLLLSPPDDKKALSLSRLIPVIQLLWVNIHPSGIAGIGLIAAAAASGAAGFVLNTRKHPHSTTFLPHAGSSQIKQLGALLAASLAVSFVNPYHLHALTAPFEFSQSSIYLKHIAEWSSLTLREIFSFHADPQVTCMKVLAVAGIISMVASRRKLNIFDAAIFIVTLIMALKSRRFIAMFAIAASPGIAAHLWHSISGFNVSVRTKSVARAASAVLVILICAHQTTRDPRLVFGAGIRERTFPAPAADFILNNHISGNMFNDYGLGGYLIWRLYPSNKVFIDGRTTLYGPSFYTEYITFERAPNRDAWLKLEKKYGLDFAVLSIGQRSVRDAIVSSSPAWRLVFWDSLSMILVKDSPRFADTIRREGYAVTEPYTVMNLPPAWETLPAGVREAAKTELERNVERSDGSLLALRALSFIYYKEGSSDRALDMALRGLKINPRLASLHALAGNLLLKSGKRDEADAHFKTAAKIDPRYKGLLH